MDQMNTTNQAKRIDRKERTGWMGVSDGGE